VRSTVFAYNSFAKEIIERIWKPHTAIIGTNGQGRKGDSPVISPDLESGNVPKISLGNHPTIKRLVQNEIKPRFYPDQPVSPIITARQKVFPIRGGVLAIASCDARVVGREI